MRAAVGQRRCGYYHLESLQDTSGCGPPRGAVYDSCSSFFHLGAKLCGAASQVKKKKVLRCENLTGLQAS